MAFENFFMNNPLGLYSLLALIPFIIIYLRRPKILTKTIPSLMFIMKQQGSIRKFSLFRKLITSLLFLIQLLILLMLAYSIAAPYLIVKDTTASKTTYLVIDASASMKTKQGSSTRFQQAIDLAEDELKGAVTIIKAGNTIDVPLKDGSKSKASSILASLKPDDSTTNIEAGMYKADVLLEGKKARVVVLSDFINTKGNQDDILKAMRILTSKGNQVIIKDVSGDADNAGIVDMFIDKETTRVFVKNYGEKKEVTLTQNKNTLQVVEQKRTMEKNSMEFFDFPSQEGIAEIVLKPMDTLDSDNTVFTSTPPAKKIKVLLLTNKGFSYLVSALTASKYVDLETRQPPFTIEQIRSSKPEVIITDNLNKDELLPGDFEGIGSLISNGTSLVITAQEDLNQIDFSDLLPVTLLELGKSTKVNKNMINQFTKDVDFSVYRSYFKAEPLNDTSVIASADDNSPLIVFKEKNKGKIIYYGLFDQDSDFKTTPGYPIFWSELINFLVDTENLADYNFKIDNLPEATNVGIYKEGDKNIAVNLLDERESDVSFENEEFNQEQKRFVIDESNIERKIDLEKNLIYLVLALIFLEIIYIKFRGDL